MSFTATSDINLELLNPGTPRIIHAKQGESYTREVSIRLYENNVPWMPPSGATFQVCYVKPDGKGGTFGSYTKGGTTYPAVTVSSNTLKVSIIPQMLEVAGIVRCEVHMQSAAILAYNERLSTFTFLIDVQKSAESDITSTDYWKAASADKIVLLNTEVGATADVSATHNVNDFLGTPHIGDTVIGTNNYIARVTAASGSTITIKATGTQWSISTAQEATFRVTVTRTGEAAFSADKTLEEITEAYNSGKVVQCVYTNEYDQWEAIILPLTYVNTDVVIFSMVDVPTQGEMPLVMLRVIGSGGGDVWADLTEKIKTDADRVAWSGKIGEYSVNNVASAIEAIGVELGQVHETPDMTYDYEASGATSVEQWATMARNDDTTAYRVAEGQYCIRGDGVTYDVQIIDISGNTARSVLVKEYDDQFCYISRYIVDNPNGSPTQAFYLSEEERRLDIDGKNLLVPTYSAADNGKFLRVGASGSPKWEKLTDAAIPDAPYTTIEKIKELGNSPYIIIRMHNLDPSRTYTLRAYTVSRHGGSNYGAWYSPRDYTEEATDAERRLGYGLLAGELVDKNQSAYSTIRFAAVPDWMPNDGYLQTKWEIPAGTAQLEIIPQSWLVPLVKPHIPEDVSSWDGGFIPSEAADSLSANLIGIGRKVHAGKLFRFCLTNDTGKIYPCRNTLKVFRRRIPDYLRVFTSGAVAAISDLQTSVF